MPVNLHYPFLRKEKVVRLIEGLLTKYRLSAKEVKISRILLGERNRILKPIKSYMLGNTLLSIAESEDGYCMVFVVSPVNPSDLEKFVLKTHYIGRKPIMRGVFLPSVAGIACAFMHFYLWSSPAYSQSIARPASPPLDIRCKSYEKTVVFILKWKGERKVIIRVIKGGRFMPYRKFALLDALIRAHFFYNAL